MKLLYSCRTGRLLAYFINISCHLQLLLVLTDLHLFKILSGSDCTQPSPVSGTMLPPLVRQRYCNAVPVSTASVSVGLCSFVTVCVGDKAWFNYTYSLTALDPEYQYGVRLYVPLIYCSTGVKYFIYYLSAVSECLCNSFLSVCNLTFFKHYLIFFFYLLYQFHLFILHLRLCSFRRELAKALVCI